MQRTQVYLGSEEVALLDRESARTGASRSELIRRAIRQRFGEVDFEARRAALQASAGAWKGRTFTGEEYVDVVREDLSDRLEQPGP